MNDILKWLEDNPLIAVGLGVLAYYIYEQINNTVPITNILPPVRQFTSASPTNANV